MNIKHLSVSVVVLVGILLAGYALSMRGSSMRADLVALGLLPHSESYTELYINDYSSIPTHLAPKEKVSFSFTVANHSGHADAYPYTVYYLNADQQPITLDEGTVTLNDSQTNSLESTFATKATSTYTTIYITLPTVQQTVHFTIPRRV